MQYGLIAQSLPHSFSKEIHERIGAALATPYLYELTELEPEALPAFLEARDFRGLNVTIPYKQTVIPLLDELTETAQQVGAVNTIVNRNGYLIGDNTDAGGMEALLSHAGISLADAKVLILGTGGTSKTALAVARRAGAREVLRVSRRADATDTDEVGIVTYDEAAAEHADADVIINTTPCGMFPELDAKPIDLAAFPQLRGVIDAIYNPLRTQLVQQAQALGIPAEGGLYMLVAQAVLAAERFLNRSIDRSLIAQLHASVLASRQNIVLVGMPSSGKTSVARRIGKLLDRDVVDCDIVIEERAGKTIPQIFDEVGEPGFRDQESAAVRDIAARTGIIIATGGGTVLRQQNVDALRQNGRLYLLERPFEQLEATGDRPLTNNAAKLRTVYDERTTFYAAAADETVQVNGGVADVARDIVRRHTGADVVSRFMLTQETSVTIRPSVATGAISAPPSKSMAHRLLICAGLAKGETVVEGLEMSQDVLATIDCLRALGATCDVQGSSARVKGVSIADVRRSVTLPCRESGSTLRFLIPLALLTGRPQEFTGSPRLMERPLDAYETICAEQGLSFRRAETSVFVNGTLGAGIYRVRGDVSSQFISGLLFALPLLEHDSRIKLVGTVESRPYIDLTLQALAVFGVQAHWENPSMLFVAGGQHYEAQGSVTVEGDWSNAAFLDAFNLLGGHVEVLGLDETSLQGDRVYRQHFATLAAGPSSRDGSLPTIDLSDCPDLGPVLMALAALGQGALFTGTRRLAMKESDRAAAMAGELGACGANVCVNDDSVLVRGGVTAPSRPLDGHGDHRIVMALSIVLSKVGGTITGAGAVTKSFPDFFDKLATLGIDMNVT